MCFVSLFPSLLCDSIFGFFRKVLVCSKDPVNSDRPGLNVNIFTFFFKIFLIKRPLKIQHKKIMLFFHIISHDLWASRPIPVAIVPFRAIYGANFGKSKFYSTVIC